MEVVCFSAAFIYRLKADSILSGSKINGMSGHSKWSQIKHQKATEDAKRGQLFSKLAQEIGAAVKQSADGAGNPMLNTLIEKARAANMPKENIERAIERAGIKDSSRKILRPWRIGRDTVG